MPTKCKYCPQEFSKSEHLNRHQRTHTGEKPFQCSVCSKSYTRSDVLARHIRGVHSGATPSVRTRQRSAKTQHSNEGTASTPQPTLETPRPLLVGNPTLDMLEPGQVATNIDSSEKNRDYSIFATPTWPFDASMDLAVDFPQLFGFPGPSVNCTPRTQYVPSPSPATGRRYPLSIGSITGDSVSDTSTEVQRAWPRRRVFPVVRRIQDLWQSVANLTQKNVFSDVPKPPDKENNTPSPARWGLDENCRQRLIDACAWKLLPAESYHGPITAPTSPHISALPETDVEVGGLSPQAPALAFPSLEMLSLSMDFYFRRFHPSLPFVHKATFDAGQSPTSLVLAMCLIGLTLVTTSGTQNFVSQQAAKLLRFCRLDLTYKALGKGGTQQLMGCLGASVLVLYLGLFPQVSLDENQAHMLAIQTLFIADKHGLFHAMDTSIPDASLFSLHDSAESSWQAWARVECVKRLILSLITIDSAYTRMLDLAANISLSRVEVVMPCAASLFNAGGPSEFQSHNHDWAALFMPVQDLSIISSTILDDFDAMSLRVLLDLLCLREASIRHRLMKSTTVDASAINFVPAILYAADGREKSIVGPLVDIAATLYARHDVFCHSNELIWHYLCMTQTADIDKIQIACGRAGPLARATALGQLQSWSETQSARRAVVHSVQIFRTLSTYRLSDDRALLPDVMLSTAAMVVATYASFGTIPVSSSPSSGCYELLEAVNVAVLGVTGFRFLLPDALSTSSSLGSESERSLRQFLNNGGGVSFGGESLADGAGMPRKLLLNYAQLLQEVCSNQESEYSQLLRSMADLFRINPETPVAT